MRASIELILATRWPWTHRRASLTHALTGAPTAAAHQHAVRAGARPVHATPLGNSVLQPLMNST